MTKELISNIKTGKMFLNILPVFGLRAMGAL